MPSAEDEAADNEARNRPEILRQAMSLYTKVREIEAEGGRVLLADSEGNVQRELVVL